MTLQPCRHQDNVSPGVRRARGPWSILLFVVTKHQVYIFGTKSSPSEAGYALRKTAKDNQQDFVLEVVDAVFKDFCVEDLLKSFVSEEHATDVSR